MMGCSAEWLSPGPALALACTMGCLGCKWFPAAVVEECKTVAAGRLLLSRPVVVVCKMAAADRQLLWPAERLSVVERMINSQALGWNI